MESIPTRDGPRILRHLYRLTLADVARQLNVSTQRAAQLERARPGTKSAERYVAAVLMAAERRERGE